MCNVYEESYLTMMIVRKDWRENNKENDGKNGLAIKENKDSLPKKRGGRGEGLVISSNQSADFPFSGRGRSVF